MSYNLFLDDERTFEDNMKFLLGQNGFGTLYSTEKWIVVRSFEDFRATVIEMGLPDRISFDHDLGSDLLDRREVGLKRKNQKSRFIHPSGMHCAHWLVDYCMGNGILLTSKIKVHSANPVGAKNIRMLLENFKKMK